MSTPDWRAGGREWCAGCGGGRACGAKWRAGIVQERVRTCKFRAPLCAMTAGIDKFAKELCKTAPPFVKTSAPFAIGRSEPAKRRFQLTSSVFQLTSSWSPTQHKTALKAKKRSSNHFGPRYSHLKPTSIGRNCAHALPGVRGCGGLSYEIRHDFFQAMSS